MASIVIVTKRTNQLFAYPYTAHMNTHLPLGVFLNDKHATTTVTSKLENPATPVTVNTVVNEDALPMTPLSNSVCGSIISEDCPGSVEMVESSIAPSMDMIADTT